MVCSERTAATSAELHFHSDRQAALSKLEYFTYSSAQSGKTKKGATIAEFPSTHFSVHLEVSR